jgi:hypothetical protein
LRLNQILLHLDVARMRQTKGQGIGGHAHGNAELNRAADRR